MPEQDNQANPLEYESTQDLVMELMKRNDASCIALFKEGAGKDEPKFRIYRAMTTPDHYLALMNFLACIELQPENYECWSEFDTDDDDEDEMKDPVLT